MWTSHFAPAFFLKPFSAETPLSLLALAGTLPDILWLALSLGGYEEIRYRPHHGCFPYDAKYPYTHSLLGMGVIGLVFGLFVTLTRGLGLKSFFAINAATISHWVLDVIVHRHDITLTPDPVSARYGFGIFDHPKILFVIDFGLLLSSLIYYSATAMPDNRRLQTKKLLTLGALFAGMQVVFSFVEIPGRQARLVHAPLFLLQLLGAVGMLDAIERRGDDVLGRVEKGVRRAVEGTRVEKAHDRKDRNTEKYWELNEIPREI